ncbi:LuxR family transcriptional regulator [Caulobacter sp. HMWF009]|nr:LuxR family transcriptional regulator [Caulobacter sp. HMWF009]PTT04883.1 LuxR family transcriptional regulator [Caulobacter sp. HMWF025]
MDQGVSQTAGTSSGLDRLTERERECLRLVDRHLSSKEIARELGLSKHTVDWHLDKARKRLGAADRYAAARLAFNRDTPPSDAPPPIGSGSDPARLGEPSSLSSTGIRQEGASHDPTRSAPEGRPDPGDLSAGGYPALSERLAAPQFDPRHGAALQLEPVDPAAFEPLGDPCQRRHGARSDQRHPQAGILQTARDGPAGDPEHRLRRDGRKLPLGSVSGRWELPRLGGGANPLNSLQRLVFIAAVMIVTALAFGSILAGLHALEAMFQPV